MITHEQLENYINTFHEQQRDAVFKQIVDAQILEKAFNTQIGKELLNHAVDLIATDVMKITRFCVDDNFDIAKVMPIAVEVNAVYKLLNQWAIILIKGEEHTKKAKKGH